MTKAYKAVVGCVVLVGVIGASSARAQEQTLPVAKEPTRTAGDIPGPIKNFARKLGGMFGGPLHPVASSIASGGGMGVGLGLDFDLSKAWSWETKGLYTIRNYWSGESRLEYSGRRTELEFYGRLRDMKNIAFFGLGNESVQDDRTAFAMRELTTGARTSYRLLPFLTLGGRAEYVNPDVREGKDPRFPSTTEIYPGEELPGVGSQSAYARVQGSADVIIPAAVGDGFYQGTIVRGSFAHFEDLDLKRYTFDRVDGEFQQKFAGLGPSQRLTLHGWVSHSIVADGQDVPIYLDRMLGSRGQLKSVHEYMLGTDGSQATLRGYDTFRFHDRDALLMQAEYRVPIWGPFEMTAFYDAGKVSPDITKNLNLKNLHDNYGFSLSFMRAHSTFARIDLGLGGEGPQWIFSLFTGEKQ